MPPTPNLDADSRAPLASVIMDLMLDAICVVDAQGRFLFVSAASERIFGYAPQEMIGRPMIDFVFPEDRARTLAAVDEIVAGQHKPNFENRYLRKDGRVVHIMWTARWSASEGFRVAVARDVTERKRAEAMQGALYTISEATHAAEDLLALFQRIHQIVGTLLPAVNFFVALYDQVQDRLSFPYYVDAFDAAPAAGPLAAGTLSAEVIRTAQPLRLTRDAATAASAPPQPDVGAATIDWLGVPLCTHNGVIGAVGVKSHAPAVRYTQADVELLKFVSTQVAAAIERKQNETWLLHSARHDALTGLPNRVLIFDRLKMALARARRDHIRLALLFLDLDRFKQVNDTFGHAVGDLLLQEVAQRLSRSVRESDTVGRMGGDEFVVLLDIQSREQAAMVAEKVRLALCEPFDLAGCPAAISSSIGIAHYPGDGDDGQQLVGSADRAMYAAKKAGGNCFRTRPPGHGDASN